MAVDSETRNSWQPPRRPEWVERLNATGDGLDARSIVRLDVDDLVSAATTSTGLSDFGTDDWREALQHLVKSLNEEADLNLMGRILTRADLLRTLEGRLRIEAAYKRNPEVDSEIIGAPLIITGAARTGTTALYNLLSADPDNRTPLLWETWFPDPPPDTATYATDPRREKADKIALLWDEIMPEFPLLHEQRGYLPVEDNYLLMYALRGPNGWMGKTPSYIQWLGAADLTPSLDYMKRVLKYLQWKHKCKRWVLKSPALTVPMPLLFAAFPDAMLVHTHRDPVKLTASSKHLMNAVFWLRSDNHLAHQDFYKVITNDDMVASVMNATIDNMESGVVPKKQIFNLQYQDFIKDNIAAVRKIYDYFGIESSDGSFAALTHYAKADAKARSVLPAYKYDNPSLETVSRLRLLYGKYQSYFGIPNEI